jgi:hypothetical protein
LNIFLYEANKITNNIITKKGYYYTIHYITAQDRLQYYVPIYKIINNVFIEIYDKRIKSFRQLALNNCEIEIKKSTISDEEELENLKFYYDRYKEYDGDDQK